MMLRDAEKKVVASIKAALLRAGAGRGSAVLVGLSGGADSVALTCAMLELRDNLGLRIVAAHLNHRIRGAESDRDEDFVRTMCGRLGLELIAERANTLDPS